MCVSTSSHNMQEVLTMCARGIFQAYHVARRDICRPVCVQSPPVTIETVHAAIMSMGNIAQRTSCKARKALGAARRAMLWLVSNSSTFMDTAHTDVTTYVLPQNEVERVVYSTQSPSTNACAHKAVPVPTLPQTCGKCTLPTRLHLCDIQTQA